MLWIADDSKLFDEWIWVTERRRWVITKDSVDRG